MEHLHLTGRVLPVGARLMIRHDFVSAEKKPLEVVYCFVLPRDAALRRFRVVTAQGSVTSRLEPTEKAIKEYEKGIEDGALSTLARTYRDGMVNLNVGNIRPGERVSVHLELGCGVETRDNGYRFRFPFTVAPVYHSAARMVEVAPGEGEIELPDDEFGDVLLPPWREDAKGLHGVSFDLSVAAAGDLKSVGSPSLPVRVQLLPEGRCRVGSGAGNVHPDGDLVLDVETDSSHAEIFGGVDRNGRSRYALVVPSAEFGVSSDAPRRVVFVLDRSGSMQGIDIEQARRALQACLAALAPEDQFDIVAFDSEVEIFRGALVAANTKNRESARRFVDMIDARGGTELLPAALRAADILGAEGGDVFLLTDGQVGGTETIISKASAAEVRIHCLGIGVASQDRFLTLLARETGGTSRFVTPGERVDMEALALFAGAGHPVARDLHLTSSADSAPRSRPDLVSRVFSTSPLVAFLESDAPWVEPLSLEWTGDDGAKTMDLQPVDRGTAEAEVIRLLQGSRVITDLEARLVEPEPWRARRGKVEERTTSRLRQRLEDAGREFQLANRCLSLVAVFHREGDVKGELPETRVVPVAMPRDTEFQAYFSHFYDIGGADLRRVAGMPARRNASAPKARRESLDALYDIEVPVFFRRDSSALSRQIGELHNYSPSGPMDILVTLAGLLESDGGVPGKTLLDRIAGSLLLLLAFREQGHTDQTGFRLHIQRLRAFVDQHLDEAQTLSGFAVACDMAGGTIPLRGDTWLTLARGVLLDHKPVNKAWKEAEKLLHKAEAK